MEEHRSQKKGSGSLFDRKIESRLELKLPDDASTGSNGRQLWGI